MKRYIPFILIAIFLTPLLGYAANAPQLSIVNTNREQGITVKQPFANKELLAIYSRLNDLSSQTQLTINQLNATGITTTLSQASLLSANTSLAQAKTDMTAFSTISVGQTKDPVSIKNAVSKTESDLNDAKTQLLASLTALKASLPTLDTTGQS